MNNKYLWLIGAVVLILIFMGGFLLLNKNNSSQQYNTQTQNPQTTQNSTAAQTQSTQTSDVTVTSSGFEPATLTIKAGTTVVWLNKSGVNVSVNSDVHPTNLLWPFLNLGQFSDGSSVSVVFPKAGTYTYHNYLIPAQKGTVIVQ